MAVPVETQRIGSAGCDCAVRLPGPRPTSMEERFAFLASPITQSLPRPTVVAEPSELRTRRRRIWDLSANLHCSIIGTCLSSDDLCRLLRKVGIGSIGATDHEMHGLGVELAGREDRAAKLLHKALDARHAGALRRFDAARNAAALRVLWRAAVDSGDIPGSYWAVLTHPALDDVVLREVFGEVHMLSHLVGAANRADIRRLAAQEHEISTLRGMVSEQRERLDAAATEHAEAAQALEVAKFARASVTTLPPPGADWEELRRRLDTAERRCGAIEVRRAEAIAEAALRRAAIAEARMGELANDLAAVEAVLVPPPAASLALPSDASMARTVLYVGGRPNQVPALRHGAARAGATLLHHDGGAEPSGGQLAGLVGRADLVVFPVDCVSHDAALAVKRLCRQAGRPFRPLRSSGMTSFLAALTEHEHPSAQL